MLVLTPTGKVDGDSKEPFGTATKAALTTEQVAALMANTAKLCLKGKVTEFIFGTGWGVCLSLQLWHPRRCSCAKQDGLWTLNIAESVRVNPKTQGNCGAGSVREFTGHILRVWIEPRNAKHAKHAKQCSLPRVFRVFSVFFCLDCLLDAASLCFSTAFPLDLTIVFLQKSDSVSKGFIKIGGAREHNLKNLTLNIPRDKLVVITGLSGSGKSSLAFDTIYAEGQRKYVESLSAYARHFLDQMQKPDVDFIEGLSPAIAIEQRSSGSSPRSIIATTTEIYDSLRLLYAHIGQPYCPETGVPIVTQTTSDIVDKILALPPRTRVMLLAPVVREQKGEFRDVVERLGREGFVRARIDGELVELANGVRVKLEPKEKHTIEAVVDRLVIDEKIRVRLSDSVETALRWGEGVLLTLHQAPNGQSQVQSLKSKVGEQGIGERRQETGDRSQNPVSSIQYPATESPSRSALAPPPSPPTRSEERR